MLYLLAIILPPLAVLMTGRVGSFVLNLFFCLFFWIPGIIHAILVVADHKADKRTDRMIKAMDKTR